MDLPAWIQPSEEVAAALAAGRPVVALETAVLTHGLPHPHNLQTVLDMEAAVRAAGAVPATVGLLRGRVRLGMTQAELAALAQAPAAVKVSRRDLAAAVVAGQDGGTTVAATLFVAHAAGLQVFATGGIGGVHRGGTGDVSADLPELARTPVAVVCAGAKAILDLPRTLEWLETAGVPVLGWQTDTFPAFFSRDSGLPVSQRVDTLEQAAALIRTHWAMGLGSGLLLAVPCPEEAALPFAAVQAALAQAEAEAAAQGVHGKALTPFLLARLAEHTGGASLEANKALLRRNARLAAELARALQTTA